MSSGAYLDAVGKRVDHALRVGPARRVFRHIPYIPPKLIFDTLPKVYRAHRGGPVTGLLEIRVGGRGGGTWTLDIQQDGLTVAEGSSVRLPDTRIVLDSRTWTKLATGRTTGTEAFMRGLLAIEGDISLSLKLDACFAPGRGRP